MSIVEFLQTLMCRCDAEGVNLRLLSGQDGCDIHLFFGETVLSFRTDAADWKNLQTLIDAIGTDVDAARTRAGGRL